MPQEIERKFLTQGDWKSKAVSSSHIIQGYIPTLYGATVRVRLKDDKIGFLTLKSPTKPGGFSRYEFEKEITPEEAKELLQLCLPVKIDKRRWIVPVGKHTFEIDEFFGDNEGLVVAEVELSAEDEEFEHPDFLAEEVTGDKRYYNSRLMVQPYSTWKNDE